MTLLAFQVYALVNPDIDTPKAQLSSNSPKQADTPTQSALDHHKPVNLNQFIQKVTRRNLFKVQVNGEQKKEPEPQEIQLEKTSLELTLWGTVTGQKEQDGWAVINDRKTKTQELYRVNDEIQGAVIKSILRNKVILTLNGKDQILEMDENSSSLQKRSTARGFSENPPKPAKPSRQDIPTPERMPDKVSQSDQLFKTRPYIRNGEASGVMVYSIKKDSVAQLLGLRNGDIIQAVDDVEIQDIQDLENFEENIGDHSDVTISILRRGKPKELVFSGEDSASSVNDVEP
nr:type II secretion system protein N [uncultured Desulfobacter sp.]